MIIEDDGLGFDVTAGPTQGFGLRGMAERAALVGGKFQITSSPSTGTVVLLEVPVE